MPSGRLPQILFVALVALLAPVVASAVLPDPTWEGGLFDGGDADWLLVLNSDQSGAVPVAPALVRPGSPVALRPTTPVACAQQFAVPFDCRAPPVR
jgi:hypothetical protein